MAKREIKFYKSFEELDRDRLREILDSTLQERWDAFWNLRKFHKHMFPESSDSSLTNKKKKLIISKPEWI
jgi:hypothetical protein